MNHVENILRVFSIRKIIHVGLLVSCYLACCIKHAINVSYATLQWNLTVEPCSGDNALQIAVGAVVAEPYGYLNHYDYTTSVRVSMT